MLRTRFTEMFGLRYPVMSAPMAMHSGATIAAAVSSAGALGSFGGMNPKGPDWIDTQVTAIRAQTDRPFAVGFITPFLGFGAPLFDAALAAAPPAVVFSFSDPKALDRASGRHRSPHDLPGPDARGRGSWRWRPARVLVAQGTEARRTHRTMALLLPLLSAVATRHPDVPLLAAGGISGGRTFAGALAAGADGAVMAHRLPGHSRGDRDP